jgi:hypothetical protein
MLDEMGNDPGDHESDEIIDDLPFVEVVEPVDPEDEGVDVTEFFA